MSRPPRKRSSSDATELVSSPTPSDVPIDAIDAGGESGAARSSGLTTAEQQLRFQASLLEAMGSTALTFDPNGVVTYANHACVTMFGWPLERIVGKHILDLIATPEARDRVVELLPQITPDGSWSGELHVSHDDGTLFPVHAQVNTVVSPEGELIGAIAVVTDIRRLKNIEHHLRESEARYRLLAENSTDVISQYDEQGNCLYMSPAASTLYGYEPDERMGKPFQPFIHPDDLARVMEVHRRALRRQDVATVAYRAKRRKGDFVWVETTARGISKSDGPGVITVTRSIAERQRLEEQIRQVQRMESIGRLAGGVAHDFNNFLTVINCYSELLLDRLEGDEASSNLVHEILEAGHRAQSLTRQLLAFSRKQILAPTLLFINEVLLAMEEMLRRLIGEDYELELSVGARVGSVRADRGQIEQVILNLVLNARDAMPQGGRIVVATGEQQLNREAIRDLPDLSPGRFVTLSVSDTGMGIEQTLQPHIFEPFFTTKGPGSGTGLGLATVYGIVKQSGGHISLQSEPNRGSCFRIYLPKRVEHRAERDEQGPHAPDSLEGHGETILLAEDDAAVRQLAHDILTRRGYHVLSARDGIEALDIAAQHPGVIHLLLADVVMPNLNGRELADRLIRQRPGTLVLHMSGYTDDEVLRRGIQDKNLPMLNKPFTPLSLARKVSEVLGGVVRRGVATASKTGDQGMCRMNDEVIKESS